ncbi:asparagine synthase (glutamine-hydrolyzing) [Sphingomonas sp. 3-13AW]|uniref:asparagine synthase (glutamine-hydrolyzing) n=1 Tax=Sphingomonas sp. 3-13AW TaxID=3050450 RepID=UPI003BB6AE7A
MCGITGIFTPYGSDPSRRDAIGRQMAARLRHRGPDADGFWSDDHVLLGHRRLAIVELSPLGAQPMASDSGRYVLSFNGEIYNFVALRDALSAAGHRFRSHSDTEVLLALIDRDGLAGALSACVGMFAIALWDRQERRLSLARDRMGEKPLYYGWCGQSLVFGSELKALTAHPGFDRRPSPAALEDVLARGFVGPADSIYASVSQVPPATIVSWDMTEIGTPDWNDGQQHRYWDRERVARDGLANPFVGSIDDAADALQATLANAIALQSHADVPVGVFLSGGVDSSLVTALMVALAPDRVRSYSIGFLSKQYDEAIAARAVADYLGTQHRDRYVSEQEALALVPDLAGIYDEPFADSSQIPMVILSRLAREDVTVALSGDGADELLGGYNKYARGDRLWHASTRPLLASGLRGADLIARPIAAMASRTNAARRIPWHSLSSASDLYQAGDRDTFIRSLGMLNRRAAQFVAVPSPSGCSGLACSSGFSYRRAAMLDDLRSYLPGDILTKVDRATMTASLESRAPFLDHRLVELCARFPDALLFDGDEGKRVARHLLYRLVPRPLVDRPKAGFMVPLGEWLRGELQPWARDLLASPATASVLNVPRCRSLLDQHCRGPHDLSARIWPILSVAAWAVATYS